jgi:hypothetical protein
LWVKITNRKKAVCVGEFDTLSASVYGGFAPYTYSWDNSLGTGNDKQISPTSKTTYKVTVTDDNGCTGTDNITIYTYSVVANAGSDQTIPEATNTTLSGSASGGSAEYSYSWTPGALLVNPTNQNPTTVNLFSTTGYTLIVTDNQYGCQSLPATMTVTVSGSVLSVVASATPNTICIGDTSQLNAIASGGTGSYNYSWISIPVGFTSSIANPKATPAVSTYYIVSVDDGLVIAKDTVLVSVNQLPTVTATATPDIICSGASSSALLATGCSTYAWSNGLGSGASKTVWPSSTTTYTVTGTDVNGCTDTEQVTVTVSGFPTVTASVTSGTICSDSSTTISASGASTYTWNQYLGSGASHIVSPATTTTYYVTGTDANGCTDTDQVTVTVIYSPNLATTATPGYIDVGDSATIEAYGAVSYIWDNGLGAGAMHRVSPASTTTYHVTGTASNGCVDTDYIILTVNTIAGANSIRVEFGTVQSATGNYELGDTLRIDTTDNTGDGGGGAMFIQELDSMRSGTLASAASYEFEVATDSGKFIIDAIHVLADTSADNLQSKFTIEVYQTDNGTVDGDDVYHNRQSLYNLIFIEEDINIQSTRLNGAKSINDSSLTFDATTYFAKYDPLFFNEDGGEWYRVQTVTSATVTEIFDDLATAKSDNCDVWQAYERRNLGMYYNQSGQTKLYIRITNSSGASRRFMVFTKITKVL